MGGCNNNSSSNGCGGSGGCGGGSGGCGGACGDKSRSGSSGFLAFANTFTTDGTVDEGYLNQGGLGTYLTAEPSGYLAPEALTITNLIVRTDKTSPYADASTLVFTVYKNGVATGLTITLTGNGDAVFLAGNKKATKSTKVKVAAGDRIDVFVDSSIAYSDNASVAATVKFSKAA